MVSGYEGVLIKEIFPLWLYYALIYSLFFFLAKTLDLLR